MTIATTMAILLAGLAHLSGPALREKGDRWSQWNVAGAAQDAVVLPVCTGPYQVSSGDLNGDGLPDLIVPCRGELLSPKLARPANDQLTVYLNPGKKGAWRRRDFTVGFGPYHSATGDLDGDGLPDIVVPNYQSNDDRDLVILYGAKDRERLFEPTTYLGFDTRDLVNEYGLDAEGQPRYSTPGLTSAIIADVNSDGRPDIVAASYQSNVFYVLLNEGGRRFRTIRYPQQAAPYDQMLGGPRDIAPADFDGDGVLDLAFSMYESNLVEVWRGDGKGGFAPWRRAPSFGRIPYHLKAGDLDGDGRADIVVGNRSTSDNVVVLRNRSDRFVYDGSFGPQTARRGETTADEIRDVVLADLDGDGILDLIAAARESGKLVFWRGTGRTGFNQAFADRRVAEFPGKGPRGIAVLPGAVAVIFYNSSEIAILKGP
ncbi:FG-GAP repeat domain-containing protein [Sphingomonas hengshuiensis]|uniref:FG-GAP repeat domain-containing protein n=1 Tax=Sphingomonas hengshuiensis TaxID=1609977 RepID=UPI00069635F7|nr:VCBS repeat-containing protein [Sphingomonas hengshuiensis]